MKTTTTIRTKRQFTAFLANMGACPEGRKWAKGKTLAQAWNACAEPGWLFWMCHRSGVNLKQMVTAECACARQALPYVKAGELRPVYCIEIAEKWCDGKATIEEVREARKAAWACCS